VYRTKDERFVAVGAQEPQFYENLLKGLGLDKKKMPEQWDREHWPATKESLTKLFKQKTLEEWRKAFDQVDACVTPVLNMDETELPHQPLVELSKSPSLNVEMQESYPELKKGEGSEEVLRDWIPAIKSRVEINSASKLVILKREAKL
jgi:alpha-methylacyl-CoA racemase